MTVDEVLQGLASLGTKEVREGMLRFGINTPQSFGVKTPVLKEFAREIKKQANNRHALALELWRTGNYDARAVAFLIDDPSKVTREQMDQWAADFDNWATVDGTCCYLFCRTQFAYEKAVEWAANNSEFIKRAGFALMAYLRSTTKKHRTKNSRAFCRSSRKRPMMTETLSAKLLTGLFARSESGAWCCTNLPSKQLRQ
jgi:3-methyladenine DNA glycosylase AlkD